VQLQFDLRKTENEDQKQNARWIVFSAIDQGRLKMDEALLELRRLEHAYTLGHVLFGAGWVEWIAGSPHQAKRYAEETVALSSEHGFPIWSQSCGRDVPKSRGQPGSDHAVGGQPPILKLTAVS
jgi:hypothetical protein